MGCAAFVVPKSYLVTSVIVIIIITPQLSKIYDTSQVPKCCMVIMLLIEQQEEGTEALFCLAFGLWYFHINREQGKTVTVYFLMELPHSEAE